MGWIITPPVSQEDLSQAFIKLVNAPTILQVPGVHDAMAGLQAKRAGFSALYLSGGAYTASLGLPDLGMITSTEVAQRAREIIRATNLPLLVDIDTGYGGVLNVARTAQEMVEAGVAAVQIEDQQLPKKCGHLNGKNLVTVEEMCQKIAILKKVAPSLVVVARTDARSVEGMAAVTTRAKAYVEAGADIIFPEAILKEEEFSSVCQALSGTPVLANMTEFGRTPYFTAEEFEAMGCALVIYPVTSLRVAAKAYERVFREIKATGTQKGALREMQTREELYETIRLHDFEALDASIAKTIVPTIGEE